MNDSSLRKMTPPEVAREYHVKPATVIAWIRSGELRAINVARHGCMRPRYRIDRADLIAFDNRRVAVPEAKVSRRRRRRDPQIIEFF